IRPERRQVVAARRVHGSHVEERHEVEEERPREVRIELAQLVERDRSEVGLAFRGRRSTGDAHPGSRGRRLVGAHSRGGEVDDESRDDERDPDLRVLTDELEQDLKDDLDETSEEIVAAAASAARVPATAAEALAAAKPRECWARGEHEEQEDEERK